jgi:hypothetical protein
VSPAVLLLRDDLLACLKQWSGDMPDDLAEILDEVETYLSESNDLVQWISCDESLPDDETTVLVFMPDADEPVAFGFHDGGEWFTASFSALPRPVTHWAEMPAGPQINTPTQP